MKTRRKQFRVTKSSETSPYYWLKWQCVAMLIYINEMITNYHMVPLQKDLPQTKSSFKSKGNSELRPKSSNYKREEERLFRVFDCQRWISMVDTHENCVNLRQGGHQLGGSEYYTVKIVNICNLRAELSNNA